MSHIDLENTEIGTVRVARWSGAKPQEAVDDLQMAELCQGLGSWLLAPFRRPSMSAYIALDRQTATVTYKRCCSAAHDYRLSSTWKCRLKHSNAEAVLVLAVGDMRVQRLR